MMATTQNFMKSKASAECIWMQGGVVRKKICRLSYRCGECRFDRAMRDAVRENQLRRDQGNPLKGNRGRLVFWRDRLLERPPWKQPCIHAMKGRIDFRACTHGYRCGDCEFDQFFQDQYAVHAVMKPVDLQTARGVVIPQGYYLHPAHVWAKIEEDGGVRVGLDDFARRVLGPPDRIETPLVGKAVARHQPAIHLHRGENTADLPVPVAGVVTDINAGLREEGWRAHESPYGSGWLMRLHADSLRQDLQGLMIGDESREFIEKEVDRLFQVIETAAGPLAADGGYPGEDIFGSLPGIGWERLNREFFSRGSA